MQTFLPPERAPLRSLQPSAYIDPTCARHAPHQHTGHHQRLKEPLAPSHAQRVGATASNQVQVAQTTDEADDLTEGTSDPPVDTSSEDAKHAELVKLQEEIEDLENAIDGLSDYYQIVDRLGEGTFRRSTRPSICSISHLRTTTGSRVVPSILCAKASATSHSRRSTSLPARSVSSTNCPSWKTYAPPSHVSYLITAFRAEDQIVAVMPYSRHRDFRDYYKEMPLGDFKYYFRCLFSALQSVHDAGIMHRDIKPANFLYDPSTGHGTLCDFGLAERFEATEWRGKCHHTCPTHQHPHGTKEINRAVDSIWFEPGKPLSGQPAPSESAASSASSVLCGSTSAAAVAAGAAANADALAVSSKSGVMDPPPERVGYLIYDARQGVRANRAGTRGFRAPEVLFKCQDQTVAIDIWSAGVILLTLLIRRFPVFNSNDDVEALLEIAVIFGKARMETCAMLHNRTFHCNIPTVGHSGSLTEFIHRLNPDLADPGHHPDPEQYRQDVANALDMVKSCLHVDCTRRKTAAELLQHPFLRIPDEEDETMDAEQQFKQYAEQPHEFADYYRQGGFDGGEGEVDEMYEQDELDDAEYAREEEVVQLQSRRTLTCEPLEVTESKSHDAQQRQNVQPEHQQSFAHGQTVTLQQM